ncbi:MAG TPA: PKD domain-containing protein [Chitinophagaceae bacterium]|nr:PKD domain-containing protein [Chitinophagaceae bacterium]
MRIILLLCFYIISIVSSYAQCTGGLSSFPYIEGFESSDGGWVSGGTGNDWAWGIPAKPVINAAGSGSRCWVVGGLTGSGYTDGEASWLQSPCFDFTNLQHPYIEFKVFWEMEQRFDGASFQYSLDNGATWTTVGRVNDPSNCLNANWFNFSPITYLSPLTSVRDGWSGNRQPTSGSCQGGNGSNGWALAKHTMPYLAGKSGVLFRFIFGAGTICNNYDGFAIDEILIKEAPANDASFTYSCVNSRTVNFTNTSALCPVSYSWNFGDPASGANNTSSLVNPSHTFSGPGKYTVALTASGPDNAPSTFTKDIYIIDAQVTMLKTVNCQTNTGGSLTVNVTGAAGIPLNLLWNTAPPQTGTVISGLSEGLYTVQISGTDVCPLTATGKAEKDFSCSGIYFPSAITPNNDGRNDGFGPLGSLLSITEYQLSVYNRWGERVFYSINPLDRWKGKIKGLNTDNNLFVWYAEFTVPGKPKETRRGTVVVIR